MVGTVAVLLNVRDANQDGSLAINSQPPKISVPPVRPDDVVVPSATSIDPLQDDADVADDKNVVSPRREEKLNSSAPIRAEKADYVESAPRKTTERRQPVSPDVVTPVAPEYLPGEESYLSTIARLEKTVDGKKDAVLKSSERYSYEKDMAIVDESIRRMKQEVRRNPKNEGAKQVLFASYQNKIDLLNSVTEKSELMASLR
jgi:hypothetical protein